MSCRFNKITVIANGFQEDYIVNYLNSLSGNIKQVDFLGSSIYPRGKIDPCVKFFDMRGGGIAGLKMWEKIKRVCVYYTCLLYTSPSPRDA